MKAELSPNLFSLWVELDVLDTNSMEKIIKDNFNKIKKYDEIYLERIGNKKFQVIMTKTEDLFGTNYTIDMNDNSVVKKRFGFVIYEGIWKGDMAEIIKKIAIMEQEDK